MFVYSSNGPVVEAVCEAEGVGPDCLEDLFGFVNNQSLKCYQTI